MKCLRCGLPIGEMPEDATPEECLCNTCYQIEENLSSIADELESLISDFRKSIDVDDNITITQKLLMAIYEDMKESSDSFNNDSDWFTLGDLKLSFFRVVFSAIEKSFED